MDYHKIAAEVSEKILSYNQDTNGWKTVKSTKDIVVSCKPSNEYSGNIYRGEGIMEGTPDTIIPFMYLPQYRTKWDKALQDYSLMEQIDEDTSICHIITYSYGMGIISSREFIDLLHVKRYEGGVVTTNSVSVEYEKNTLYSTKHIRGQ
ncbi:stAR-related lipid transfer protein 6-like isoform 1-T2 [Discoglossus pictus]